MGANEMSRIEREKQTVCKMNISIWLTLLVTVWIIVSMVKTRLLARTALLTVMRLKSVSRYVR